MPGSRRSDRLTSVAGMPSGEHRGELHADGPAADDDDVVRGGRHRVDAVAVVDVGIVEGNPRVVRRARPSGHQDRARGQLALHSIRRGDADGAVRTESRGSLQVSDAAGGEPVGDDVLQHIAHVFNPGAQGWHHHLHRRRRPHAIDLLLAVAGQVVRGFAQGLGGCPAGGGDHPAGLVSLDDQRSAPEGRRELGGDLPGRAGADHHQVVAVDHD